ncbi:MAG: DUF6036 family nucleotidyltransferase [Ilumatobacteraceae bacterium]
MNREELAHVLRAASQIVDDPDIIVVGSQAILGSFREDELPVAAVVSMEAALAFRADADGSKSDSVDGAIGEGSPFHEMYSYYAPGVTITTAVLPTGWEERTVQYERLDALPSHAVCLEPHDLVISKLVAGREKDFDFATALIGAGLVDTELLRERATTLPVPGGVVRRVSDSISRCDRRARGA